MNILMKPVVAGIMLFVASAEQSCTNTESASDKLQRIQQEQLSRESNMQVGMPAIVNFQEKRMAKMILELRDNPKLSTITYIRDMQGKLHKICDSIGYGLPYATQYTNPSKMSYSPGGSAVLTLPQADPNGLFSPPTAEATWVLCVNPAEKNVSPVYIEDRITVSQFALSSD